ncbi:MULTISPECIES: hypothetical protein [Serratia]|uniref:hypothetical protein n=1 Tax=Serratia TaxID=613 RepID=UPI0005763D4B|nr:MULTISPECIES: hypothetical protein [Serratia]SAQ02781.1 Uncharacterised protein [Klebsiella oxytoca]AWQ49669.1 hypothetical protein B1A42_20960 [Serratia marcescens]EIJ7462050.1 hypothetical protein [Serratia marcescens]EJA2552574.1 hypothetical protein [Serratia marcescens]EJA2596655.1 hypothetical protein [Serratia marcescens]
MKVSSRRAFYLALSAAIALVIVILIYLLTASRDFPECNASLSTTRMTPNGTVTSGLYVNIVRSGWRRATITLNGLAYQDGKKQVIARVLETKYHYHRGYYYVAIEKKILQPMDNFTYSDAQTFLLGEEKHYYVLKIAKLNDDNFIMYYGRQPELLCSVTRK